jgi:hypothetical protein
MVIVPLALIAATAPEPDVEVAAASLAAAEEAAVDVLAVLEEPQAPAETAMAAARSSAASFFIFITYILLKITESVPRKFPGTPINKWTALLLYVKEQPCH